jgi:hypothetical protein
MFGEDTLIDLTNLTILAVVAAQVASKTAQGKDGPAWMKMVQRFFLNRVRGDRGEYPKTLSEQGPILVYPGPAFAILPVFQGTAVGTQQAMYKVILQLFIVGSFLHEIKLQRKSDEFHHQTKQPIFGLYIVIN